MRIERDIYLEKLKRGIGNGMIKVITGIRRCGKSYLLSELFREYLASIGIDEAHIIEVALDDRANAALRDPDAMMAYVITSKTGVDGELGERLARSFLQSPG